MFRFLAALLLAFALLPAFGAELPLDTIRLPQGFDISLHARVPGARSPPLGYRITLVKLREGRAAGYETFAEGWLQGGNAWGRPVDLQLMPDGSMLVSDDKAGAIYRIGYRGKP